MKCVPTKQRRVTFYAWNFMNKALVGYLRNGSGLLVFAINPILFKNCSVLLLNVGLRLAVRTSE